MPLSTRLPLPHTPVATNLVHDAPDHAKRVLRRHPILKVYVAEKTAALFVLASHGSLLLDKVRESQITPFGESFSAAC